MRTRLKPTSLYSQLYYMLKRKCKLNKFLTTKLYPQLLFYLLIYFLVFILIQGFLNLPRLALKILCAQASIELAILLPQLPK